MKTLLWYQQEKIGDPEIVCKDGEILCGYPRIEAFSYLKAASDKCLKHDLPWCGVAKLPSSEDKSKKVKLFFLKGKFKSVDEHGRILTFMYLAARGYDNLEAINNVLEVVHQELSDDTLKCLTKCLTKKKRTLINAVVFVAIIVLLATILTLMC